jgi:hypothetical protein
MAGGLSVEVPRPPGEPVQEGPGEKPWPMSLPVRIGVSLLLAVPYVIFTVLLYRSGYQSAAHAIVLRDADFFAASGNPPYLFQSGSFVSDVLAVFVRSQLGLGIVSSVLAGAGILLAARRVRELGRSNRLTLALVATVAVLPPFFLSVAQSLPRALLLFALVVVLAGARGFTSHRDTFDGFSAGLWLAGGALANVQLPVFALFLIPTAPVIVLVRERWQRPVSVGAATLLVILFPLLSLAAMVELVSWLMLGAPLSLGNLAWSLEVFGSLGANVLSFSRPALLLEMIPCLAVWLTGLVLTVRTEPSRVAVVVATPVLLLILIGAGYPIELMLALCVAAIMGVTAVPERVGRRSEIALLIACGVQVAAATTVWAVNA